MCEKSESIVPRDFISKSFIFVGVMLFEKFENKTPSNITRYTVGHPDIAMRILSLCPGIVTTHSVTTVCWTNQAIHVLTPLLTGMHSHLPWIMFICIIHGIWPFMVEETILSTQATHAEIPLCMILNYILPLYVTYRMSCYYFRTSLMSQKV